MVNKDVYMGCGGRMQVDNNVRAAFAMKAQHLVQFVYREAHSDDADRKVVFNSSDGAPFTLLQVSLSLSLSLSLSSLIFLLGSNIFHWRLTYVHRVSKKAGRNVVTIY